MGVFVRTIIYYHEFGALDCGYNHPLHNTPYRPGQGGLADAKAFCFAAYFVTVSCAKVTAFCVYKSHSQSSPRVIDSELINTIHGLRRVLKYQGSLPMVSGWLLGYQ